MITINKGKNYIFINSEGDNVNYDIILSKSGSIPIHLMCYVIEETDLYKKIQFNINEDLSGEYGYSVVSDNVVIDSGIAKINKINNNYKEYGK